MINERSLRLAASKRPYGTTAIYDLFIEEKQEFDKRMELMRQAKEESEELNYY